MASLYTMHRNTFRTNGRSCILHEKLYAFNSKTTRSVSFSDTEIAALRKSPVLYKMAIQKYQRTEYGVVSCDTIPSHQLLGVFVGEFLSFDTKAAADAHYEQHEFSLELFHGAATNLYTLTGRGVEKCKCWRFDPVLDGDLNAWDKHM